MKSNRGVEFRRWANSVLQQYILQGYAVNQNRVKQLGEVIRIMKQTENELGSRQVLSVIEKYNEALDLLDAYDHQTLFRPKGNEAIYVPTYRSVWKSSERCGSATNRTCSDGKRTTRFQEASATSTRPTADGMCTNLGGKSGESAVLCDKESKLL